MNYWQERMLKSQEEITNKSIKEIEKQLMRYYRQSTLRVISSFEAVYNNILKQAAEGKQITPALLYKLDNYWQAQAQIQKELEILGDRETILLAKQFEDEYISIYNSIAIPGSEAFNTISNENVKQLINQVWVADGKSWSDRVWHSKKLLAETLNEELLHCALTGEKTSHLKKVLQERFNVSYSQANSIARTELAHIQTQAAQQRYKDYGIQEVQVWADADERRCQECGKLHKQKFFINQQMPVPVHPNCRCCVIPVID